MLRNVAVNHRPLERIMAWTEAPPFPRLTSKHVERTREQTGSSTPCFNPSARGTLMAAVLVTRPMQPGCDAGTMDRSEAANGRLSDGQFGLKSEASVNGPGVAGMFGMSIPSM